MSDAGFFARLSQARESASGRATELAAYVEYFDGSWLDLASVVFAVIYVWWQWRQRPIETRGAFICKDIGAEIANATSLFPLVLLSLSSFSSKLANALISGNRIILSVAGMFALFALLEKKPIVIPITATTRRRGRPPKAKADDAGDSLPPT